MNTGALWISPAAPTASSSRALALGGALAAFVAAMAVTGCNDPNSRVSSASTPLRASPCCALPQPESAGGGGPPAPQEAQNIQRVPYGSLLAAGWGEAREALRVRIDRAHNRLWVLGLDRVEVFDLAKETLIRRIALPAWSVAEFVCRPDLVLERSGAAVISHNAEPRLWRIDPDSFALREHTLRLWNRERWEIGFGGLALAPDGTLFGLAASGGSLWQIDIGSDSAHEVELDALVPESCALVFPPQGHRRNRGLAMCAGAGSLSRRIELSSDRARGRVVDESCDAANPDIAHGGG